ncbi:MAG: hypothetical protein ACLUIS_04385 [Longibaculum sp.]
MSDMGANVIRIYTIYNDTFYDAFMIIMSIMINHYIYYKVFKYQSGQQFSNDAYSMDFYDSLKKIV